MRNQGYDLSAGEDEAEKDSDNPIGPQLLRQSCHGLCGCDSLGLRRRAVQRAVVDLWIAHQDVPPMITGRSRCVVINPPMKKPITATSDVRRSAERPEIAWPEVQPFA